MSVSSAPLVCAYDSASGVLTVVGDVESESVSALREAIAGHSADGTTGLAVDLSRVTYFPSAAIGMLVKTSMTFKAAGTPFEIVAVAGSVVDRLLHLCAIEHRAS